MRTKEQEAEIDKIKTDIKDLERQAKEKRYELKKINIPTEEDIKSFKRKV